MKTIKTLKDKLAKINDMSRDLTDNQLKELVNLGNIISDKVSTGGVHKENSTIYNSFAQAMNGNQTIRSESPIRNNSRQDQI